MELSLRDGERRKNNEAMKAGIIDVCMNSFSHLFIYLYTSGCQLCCSIGCLFGSPNIIYDRNGAAKKNGNLLSVLGNYEGRTVTL